VNSLRLRRRLLSSALRTFTHELYTSSGYDRDLAGQSVPSSIVINVDAGFRRIIAKNAGAELH